LYDSNFEQWKLKLIFDRLFLQNSDTLGASNCFCFCQVQEGSQGAKVELSRLRQDGGGWRDLPREDGHQPEGSPRDRDLVPEEAVRHLVQGKLMFRVRF
jgi:hypothetical protein